MGVAGNDGGHDQRHHDAQPFQPRTFSCGSTTASSSLPMRAVPTGWKMVVAMSPAARHNSSGVEICAPGLILRPEFAHAFRHHQPSRLLHALHCHFAVAIGGQMVDCTIRGGWRGSTGEQCAHGRVI